MCELIKNNERGELDSIGPLYIPKTKNGTKCLYEYWIEVMPKSGQVQCHHGNGNWEDLPAPTDDESVYVPANSYLRIVEDDS